MSFENTVDWDRRRKVILEVQASGGMARDAAARLGISTEAVLKTSRKLCIRFPAVNGFPDDMKRGKARKGPPNAGTVAVAAQNKTHWAAYHQRRRFASALEAAPPQRLSDAELVDRAIAEGRVTKVPPGSGLMPMWLAGITDNCVKPRAGASKGGRS